MAKNDIGRSPSLIFKMFILVTWLSSSFKSAVVYQISSKSDDFSLRYGDLTICSMAGVRSVELLNLEFMSRDLYRRVILLLCAKFQFHWNRTIGCWVMAKKTIFKMAAVRHLEFKKLIFGHVTVTEFQISCCVRNVTEIARFFIEIWQFHDFQDGGDPPFTILEIQ